MQETSIYSDDASRRHPESFGSEQSSVHEASRADHADSHFYPLHDAIRQRNISLVDDVLTRGADIELASGDGDKPLYLACKMGLIEVLQALLLAGADVESVNERSPTHPTALYWAVGKHNTQMTELLLQHGANVNERNSFGTTPLLGAIRNRDIETIQLLLRYRADKNVRDGAGSTPLTLAQGSDDIIALLEISQGPPTTVSGRTYRRQPRQCLPQPPKNNTSKMIACHGYQATVVDFFVGGDFEQYNNVSMSVYQLLYGDGPIMVPPQRGRLRGKKRDFRWYHLPVNNVGDATFYVVGLL